MVKIAIIKKPGFYEKNPGFIGKTRVFRWVDIFEQKPGFLPTLIEILVKSYTIPLNIFFLFVNCLRK